MCVHLMRPARHRDSVEEEGAFDVVDHHSAVRKDQTSLLLPFCGIITRPMKSETFHCLFCQVRLGPCHIVQNKFQVELLPRF